MDPAKVKAWQQRNGLTDAEVQAALAYLAKDKGRWDPAVGEPVDFWTWATVPGYRMSEKALALSTRKRSDHVGGLYPVVLEELCRINSGGYSELVCTGAIGAAKTTVVVETQAYQLYRLLSLRSPQLEYELDPADEIEIIFQSLNLAKAREIGFDRFRARIERSPWFQRWYPHDRSVTSRIEFPSKRIVVKPVIADKTGAMGENVIGGLIDETEFQGIVKDSKRAADGGTYHQARENYNALANRRASRFQSAGGNTPGMLALVSSANRRAGFIEERASAAREDSRIYVYRKRHWDIAPWRYPEETFPVFIGDDSRTPFVPKDDGSGRQVTQQDRDAGLVVDVPRTQDMVNAFKRDILSALRDMAGVGTDALHPFIANKEPVQACFGKTDSILTVESCDFETVTPRILHTLMRNPEEPRFAHVDLAATQDCAGLCVGHVEGFRRVHRGSAMVERDGEQVEHREWEVCPVIRIDCILQISPPAGGEIQFHKIRELLYGMKARGIPITWVTADKFQSRDFLQEMRRRGYRVGLTSMDEDTWGYDVTKEALYDGRVLIPEHPVCERELIQLEKDLKNPKRPKVDHPPDGSKDCSDALAGVVSGLSRRIEVWRRHGLRPRDVPHSIAMRPKRVGKEAEDQSDVG